MQPTGLSAANVLGAAILGYLLGAVPFGYLAGKTRGIDVRQHGSGVIGATNTLRVLGPAFALVVGLLDVSKGLVSALLGRHIAGDPAWGVAIGGAAAITGHSWSIFLGFGGGKSVAASTGVLLPFMPQLGVVALLVFVLLVTTTRYVSLGSIGGAVTASVLGLLWPGLPLPYRLFLLYAATLILYRHRANVRRLLAGTESRFGQRVDPRAGVGSGAGVAPASARRSAGPARPNGSSKGGNQGD